MREVAFELAFKDGQRDKNGYNMNKPKAPVQESVRFLYSLLV